ncbi:MAG: sigma-54-dependent Fis family transcriptional regulator [Alphaproteobacteria bacterium]|nr:sigma-54-dependent Fis family transcriptional regulator [Alphaproteobacteria bacterium]
MATPLLWVEDDPALRRVYRPLLQAEGFEVTEAGDPAEALAAARRAPPQVVLLDLMLPPSQTTAEGFGVLDALLERDPGTKVVVVTGAGARTTALEAVRRGAHDFLTKPVDPDVLLVVLQRALARARLEAQVTSLRDQLAQARPRGSMIGGSAPFQAAVDLADRVAPTDLPVLVTGENGTGKELLARRVHEASRRSERPFVAVNCGALPPTLLESTLFGHVRGAFTGADRSRRGLFQEAHTGTLFLDEVGEMEPPTQVRLLRALESGEILPVGADRPVTVDVRIVSATNRKLEEMVSTGAFRDDLYWRLRGIEITLPPLRDRGDDVLLLARHFLTDAPLGGPHTLSPRAEDALRAHPWPGNLRELRHAMQRAAVMAGPRRLIEPQDLGLRAPDTPDGDTLAEQVEALERRAIAAALAAEGGNRTRAAKRLGLSRQGLLNKMARFELE